MSSAIIWFRCDLRVADNPALQQALARGLTPVPVYILDDGETNGSASAWWLHHSLLALRESLRSLGSDLLVYRGDSADLLGELATRHKAAAVFWNRRYEPRQIERDKTIKASLRLSGIDTESFSAALLREPWNFGKADKSPYRVFTPFWKALQKTGPARNSSPAPAGLPAIGKPHINPLDIEQLGLLDEIAWYSGFSEYHTPGEAGAWQRLQDFFDTSVLDYARERDYPALSATSRLSAHLHFGEISPLQIREFAQAHAHRSTAPGVIAASEAFLRQIAWREFASHLLFHFPHTSEAPLDPRYVHFPWEKDYQPVLQAWQQGRTGIPIVDAGMRELWATGWMHNRVRMIAASLLTKNLLIPWQRGAEWFEDTLVDADLANNRFGWQWTAGSGADAAPYFRIFNPVTQGQRFDADGSYVRRWVPELARLPAKWIHSPWDAPPEILADAGVVLDNTYPAPLVDLKTSRERALAAWDRVKRQSA